MNNGRARKINKSDVNPYAKYSYNTGLIMNNKPVWGIDSKYLMWEIKHGRGIPYIDYDPPHLK